MTKRPAALNPPSQDYFGVIWDDILTEAAISISRANKGRIEKLGDAPLFIQYPPSMREVSSKYSPEARDFLTDDSIKDAVETQCKKKLHHGQLIPPILLGKPI